ncbi:MAG: endolytic transglycosylase MltG [candidate division WOR-3 bacterium]|nr:MAG: endolytic transglycosylase MltG [candidate division WOR-3 bacterium]
MKKKLIIAALLLLFVAWWQPFNIGRTEVTISENMNAREIARVLAERGIVRNVDEFLLSLKIMGREKQLKSGTYELYRYKSPFYVIGNLSSGGRSEIVVTIPEGSTIYETAQILANHGLVDSSRFINLCQSEKMISESGVGGSSLEGYLFPDTYSLSSLQSEESIIGMMLKNFRKRTAGFHAGDRDSLHQVVILASIVEREAKYEDERPIIARVFVNRLKAKRPLESCATIFYIKKTTGTYIPNHKLTDRDLLIDSPFNTYVHLGLPPGPICSPGESSINAAVTPADVDFLYFVAKGDGRHHFSRTYREHAAAKDRYQ